MPVIQSEIDVHGTAFAQNRETMLATIAGFREVEQKVLDKANEAKAKFEKRGQLLPRERINLLLDPGAPFLELASLAGYKLHDDKDGSMAGGGLIAGIGYIQGVRSLVIANNSAIKGGTISPSGLKKSLRLQQIAFENKLPVVTLAESGGANLNYAAEIFVEGARGFANQVRMSAIGLPQITVVHGSSTAGGAYQPGLSDYVVVVRGKAKMFLAGPPLLKAATGEVATEEELGGAEMHTSVSGLGEYLAEDDRHALGIARQVIAGFYKSNMAVAPAVWAQAAINNEANASPFNTDELLGLMPAHHREPVDMREVMARLVDGGALLEFKPLYGTATLCAQASLGGHRVGLISNNGPIDVAGANKATHFIQWMCQLGHPIVYLQNTTGYMVGTQAEQGGMIKHGSKMTQAVTNATVPQITIQCGASFGAGNYGMCGRGYAPRFLFSWPSARTAVMGGEQAARTMQIVTEAALARKGLQPDAEQSQQQFDQIVAMFEAQADAFYTSGLLLDDGVIDPRDTRAVLALCLDTIAEGAAREIRPMQFGVARM